MKKKTSFKVCYFLKRYPRLSQTFIFNEMLELKRQGLDLVVVALKGSGEEVVHEKCNLLDAPVYYLSDPEVESRSGWVAGPSGAPARLGSDRLQGEGDSGEPEDHAALIAPLVKRLGVDHLHAHFATWAAGAAASVSRQTGIPYSFTAHARDIYHESVDKKRLALLIEGARFVITVSDFNRRYLEELVRFEGGHGKMIRLYNGIDLAQFSPSDAPKEAGLLVSVGRLVRKKGFHDLVAACKILKERGKPFHCAIVGEGEERDALARQIAQFGLQKEITLPGARPQTEVIRLIQRAEMFVLPCRVGEDGDRDGLPTVLLEAMALGVPVISTSIAGIPEIVSHRRNGLLVEEKNPEQLAQAVEWLSDETARRKRFVGSALSKVRKDFNLIRNVKKLKGYFLSDGGSR